MTGLTAVSRIEERLLTFEVAGAVHAIPIACVVEVCEPAPLACIPTLSPATAAVMNHHGDALPVLNPASILEVDETRLPEPTQVLVICAQPTGGACLGLPVDRIVGIVDGAGLASRGRGPVTERRPIDGRVACVLDPARLLGRAEEVIETSLARSG